MSLKIARARESFSGFREGDFRPHQEEAIQFALESNKKVVALSAPTGAGKSLIGMCMARLGGDTCYLVHSKTLQHQIVEDFPEASKLFGRNNYQCNMSPYRTAADCLQCGEPQHCPYKLAKAAVLKAPLRILNYQYYIHEANYIGLFSNKDLIVCDEADTLEGLLTDHISLSFNEEYIRKLNLKPPKYVTTSSPHAIEEWRDWASSVLLQLSHMLAELDGKANDLLVKDTDDHAEILKEMRRVSSLQKSVKIFIDNVDETWLYERTTRHWKFRPLWLTPKLTDEYFWRHSKKFVLMSATFPPVPVLCQQLGIEIGDVDFMEIPSAFDPDRREVICIPTAAISYKSEYEDYVKLRAQVKNILAAHPNAKGLIHCTSYRVRDYIMQIDNPRLVTHRNSLDREATLDKFRKSPLPLVMVSPSFERGVNLEHDLCRFIVWVKAPFLNLKDKVTSQRTYSSKLGGYWYRSDMACKVVQGAGRGMRHSDDRCTTYILDTHIIDALKKDPQMFPNWFREAVWHRQGVTV